MVISALLAFAIHRSSRALPARAGSDDSEPRDTKRFHSEIVERQEFYDPFKNGIVSEMRRLMEDPSLRIAPKERGAKPIIFLVHHRL
jgi:hypothetical protein